MKFFTKHSRILTLCLSITYCLSPNGLGTLIDSGFSYLDSQWSFACKGFGCQCDLAGRELPNCRCDHTAPEEESCCSVVLSSCQDSTCEPESDGHYSHEIMKKPGCDGLLIEEDLSVQKHPPTLMLQIESKECFELSPVAGPLFFDYDFNFHMTVHKVPIL